MQLLIWKVICLFGLITINACDMPSDQRPNIIYIFTDQQYAGMMSCAGNDWVKTPAMDYIASNGMRFTRAYTTNPVCTPARMSMITGRFPSYFKDKNGNPIRENWGGTRIEEIPKEVLLTNIAHYAQNAGYELIFGGKEHLPKGLLPDSLGFTYISDNERGELAKEAAKVIRKQHDKPYIMIVSLINPHDICYMAIRDFAQTQQDSILLTKGQTELSELDRALKTPDGVSEEDFFANYCPPLPPNFEKQKGEPAAIQKLVSNRPFRENAREKYSENQWRMHKWAYARLTEVVDGEIQLILDALKDSNTEEKTLVMLSSDHGDMDAAHRMEHKSTMYEEATNVPFLAMWKGKFMSGQVDDTHLVSNGLDFLPTICDYMNIEGKADPRGMSLRPLFEGKSVNWRKNLGVESEIGKMVVTEDGFKYIRYDFIGIEEQLLDLNLDPFETTHFTESKNHKVKLEELRKVYEKSWFPSL